MKLFKVFLAFGIILGFMITSISGWSWYKDEKFMNTAEKTTGIISNIEIESDPSTIETMGTTYHYVYVSFYANDKLYKDILVANGKWDYSMEIGKLVDLYYSPDEPSCVIIKPNILAELFFICFGILALTICTFLYIKLSLIFKRTSKRSISQN